MKREPVLRNIILVFIVALVGYIAVYSFIEHRRVRNGPWQFTFTNDADGQPALIVNQSRLGITNVWIKFSSPTNSQAHDIGLAFDAPLPTPFDVPFGQCIFMDMTSLPGTIVFEMFGHQVQFLPRVLTIDLEERPWESNLRISLLPQTSTPFPHP